MLPKKVPVLGMNYKIIRKLPNNHSHENHPILGLCDNESRFIYVKKGLSIEESWRCFFHEFQHATDYRNGLAFTGLSADTLEMHAESNASAIYELLDHLGVWGE